MFGLYPILIVSVICFFLTAFFECFIRLDYTPIHTQDGILAIVKNDSSVSMRFITKEQPNILKLLLLVGVINFFVVGLATVGMPFMIRNILGLNATYYGVAESTTGAAAVAGSIIAGLLVTKLKIQKLYLLLTILGISFLPSGLAFLFNTPAIVSYAAIIVSFGLIQLTASIFSIFGLSVIQQKVSNELLGKIMSCVVTVTMFAQPLGQMVYGILFDKLSNKSFFILIPTSIVLCLIGIASKKVFASF